MANSNNDKKKLVCYFTNWSQYREGKGKFVPEDIDPNICTHIILAFAKIENNQLVPSDSNDIGKEGLYARVNQLKKANPKLKTLLALGGGTKEHAATIKEMSSTQSSRKKFIKSVIPILSTHGFDGLDMDWEYPSNTTEKNNFTLLMQELRRNFDNKNPRLLLSAAVPSNFEVVEAGYNVPALSRCVDFFNLMTYDFHGSWESRTGHNTPLFSHTGDSPYSEKLTVSNAASFWAKKGAPKNKLVVGLATYGRTFTLADPAGSGINAEAISGGKPGPYTKAVGILAYYEICQMLKDGARYVWDQEMQVPYAVKGDQWIGYDDESSIRTKAAWIKQNNFGGAMVWCIDFDDFKGNFSVTNFPLIKTMKSELGIPEIQTSKYKPFGDLLKEVDFPEIQTYKYKPLDDLLKELDIPEIQTPKYKILDDLKELGIPEDRTSKNESIDDLLKRMKF